jgi:hypothetical protein
MYTPRSKRNIISFSLIGHNYHVSVPNQPLASYNEGLLQLGRSESGVSIIPPTSSTSILEIPYSKIRRFGYQVVMESYDVIWFEICSCKDDEQEFAFFVVASGMDRAMLIAGDLKTKIEKETGRFLIMEDDRHPESIYISRGHYGCPPYPRLGRERVLHAGLVNLEATKIVGSSGLKRRLSEPSTAQFLLNPANERRNTVQSLLGTKSPNLSPRHSPIRSPSPARSTSPNTAGTSLQDMVRRHNKEGNVPGSTSDPTADYTRKTLTAFEQGRRSDGGYLAMSDGAPKLSNWKNKRPSDASIPRGGKLSLADLKIDRVSSGGSTSSSQEKFFPSKDSGIGTSADLVLDQDGRVVANSFHSSPSPSPSPYSKGKRSPHLFRSSYDHLDPPSRKTSQSSYDHLPEDAANGGASPQRNVCPPIPPRSGVSMGDAYIDF